MPDTLPYFASWLLLPCANALCTLGSVLHCPHTWRALFLPTYDRLAGAVCHLTLICVEPWFSALVHGLTGLGLFPRAFYHVDDSPVTACNCDSWCIRVRLALNAAAIQDPDVFPCYLGLLVLDGRPGLKMHP